MGIAIATPAVFLQNTADVQAATLHFLKEYNRLAKLAADAPDIHIYQDDKLQRVQPSQTHHRSQPAVNPLQGLNFYTFTASLGGQNQFQPHQISRSFDQVHQAPVQRSVQNVVRPQHQQVIVRQVQPVEPIRKWTGPMADTVPAGVQGLPRDVTPTPEVSAARSAHFAVLVDAYQRAAAHRPVNQI